MTFNSTQVEWDDPDFTPELNAELLTSEELHDQRLQDMQCRNSPLVQREQEGARQGGNIVPPPAQALPAPNSAIPLQPQVSSPPVAQPPVDDGNDQIEANLPIPGPDANQSLPRCSTRSNKGVAPTRLQYEVEGTPTTFMLLLPLSRSSLGWCQS